VTRLLQEAGRTDDAIDWLLAHATKARSSEAFWRAEQLLERAGRTDEAAKLRKYGLEPTGHIAKQWS
jgi:hypothetical protein